MNQIFPLFERGLSSLAPYVPPILRGGGLQRVLVWARDTLKGMQDPEPLTPHACPLQFRA